MRFGSEHTLGIEITPLQIKLVELDPRVFPYKVLRFDVLDVVSPHPEHIVQQVESALQEGGFTTRSANCTVSDPSIRYHQMVLPSMQPEEMKAVVEREVRMNAPFPLEEAVFDWLVLRETEGERGGKRSEVVAVIAPLQAVHDQISFLEWSGLQPGVLTTVPLALQSSLRCMGGIEHGVVAFLHLGTEVGHLLFLKEGAWIFHREFPLGEAGGDEERVHPLLSDRVLTEATRSLNYFKQEFRGQEVRRIIVSEEVEDIGLIKDAWMSRLGVEVDRYDPSFGLDLSPLNIRGEEFRTVLPSLIIPLGLAAESPRRCLINLVPLEIRRKRARAIQRLVATGLGGGLLLLLAAGYAGLSYMVHRYAGMRDEQQAILKEHHPSLGIIQGVDEERALHEKRLSFLKSLDQAEVPWLEIFRDLSLFVPDEIVLQSVKVERVEGQWQTRIKGDVRASDLAATTEAFDRFHSALKASPFFTNVGLTPLQTSRPQGEEGGSSKIQFEITCELLGEERAAP